MGTHILYWKDNMNKRYIFILGKDVILFHTLIKEQLQCYLSFSMQENITKITVNYAYTVYQSKIIK